MNMGNAELAEVRGMNQIWRVRQGTRPNQDGAFALDYTMNGGNVKIGTLMLGRQRCTKKNKPTGKPPTKNPRTPRPTPEATVDCADVIKKFGTGPGQINYRVTIDHKESKNWVPVKFYFDGPLTNLHSPNTETKGALWRGQGGTLWGMRLRGRSFSQRPKNIRIEGHFDRSNKRPQLVTVVYGTWRCAYNLEPTTPPTTNAPVTIGGGTCDAYIQDQQDSDNGQTGSLVLPVSADLDTWTVEVRYCFFVWL